MSMDIPDEINVNTKQTETNIKIYNRHYKLITKM